MPRGAAFAVFTLIALAGCGGDSDKASQTNPRPGHARCFENVGARFARDREDVGFYFADLRRGEADHPRSVFVDAFTAAIEEWVSVQQAGRPYEWVLWAAHPQRPGERAQAEVAEILASGDQRSYVAYLRKPNEEQLDTINRCLERLR